MKKTILFLSLSLLTMTAGAKGAKGLKDAIGKYFLIGAAINTSQSSGADTASVRIIRTHFNTIVAENCMKSGSIQPTQGVFNWKDADQFVKFAEDNHIVPTGHCLVWHSQAPRWIFNDANGQRVSRDTLIERMHKHIAAVVGRYKGRIRGWDVVNEAIEDDGSMRRSPWYQIIGPDFITLAFKFAHEADPNAELYYNDYSMANPKKRATVCQLIRQLKAAGCRIDAVGMQSHVGLDYPDLKDYEASIDSFVANGVKVMFTELDINCLPNPNNYQGANVGSAFGSSNRSNDPYPNGLPDSLQQKFEQRYLDLFGIYYKHRKDILRVTLWGISDKTSWLNNFPVFGRTNYPLFFDRKNQEKPIVKKVMKLFK